MIIMCLMESRVVYMLCLSMIIVSDHHVFDGEQGCVYAMFINDHCQ